SVSFPYSRQWRKRKSSRLNRLFPCTRIQQEPEETTMSTTAAAFPDTPIERSTKHTTRIYLKEAKYEFLKNLRLRVYTVSVITFPLMFYVLFGLVLNAKE